jgi:hypothetical protein
MEHPAIERTQNNVAILTVIFAVTLCNERFPAEENRDGFLKIDSVLFDIRRVLLFVPFEHSANVATKVATNKSTGTWGGAARAAGRSLVFRAGPTQAGLYKPASGNQP